MESGAAKAKLMQLVELGDLFIGNSLLLELPPGGKTLIETTKGPVAGIAPRAGNAFGGMPKTKATRSSAGTPGLLQGRTMGAE